MHPLQASSAFQPFSGAFQVRFSFSQGFCSLLNRVCNEVGLGCKVRGRNPLETSSAFQPFSGAFQVRFSFFLGFLLGFPGLLLFGCQSSPRSPPAGFSRNFGVVWRGPRCRGWVLEAAVFC